MSSVWEPGLSDWDSTDSAIAEKDRIPVRPTAPVVVPGSEGSSDPPRCRGLGQHFDADIANGKTSLPVWARAAVWFVRTSAFCFVILACFSFLVLLAGFSCVYLPGCVESSWLQEQLFYLLSWLICPEPFAHCFACWDWNCTMVARGTALVDQRVHYQRWAWFDEISVFQIPPEVWCFRYVFAAQVPPRYEERKSFCNWGLPPQESARMGVSRKRAGLCWCHDGFTKSWGMFLRPKYPQLPVIRRDAQWIYWIINYN